MTSFISYSKEKYQVWSTIVIFRLWWAASSLFKQSTFYLQTRRVKWRQHHDFEAIISTISSCSGWQHYYEEASRHYLFLQPTWARWQGVEIMPPATIISHVWLQAIIKMSSERVSRPHETDERRFRPMLCRLRYQWRGSQSWHGDGCGFRGDKNVVSPMRNDLAWAPQSNATYRSRRAMR